MDTKKVSLKRVVEEDIFLEVKRVSSLLVIQTDIKKTIDMQEIKKRQIIK